jgi:hypothetical protein
MARMQASGKSVKMADVATWKWYCWLMKGWMRELQNQNLKAETLRWNPPHPSPLLHKCVEEREKTQEASLHEPAVCKRQAPQRLLYLRAVQR